MIFAYNVRVPYTFKTPQPSKNLEPLTQAPSISVIIAAYNAEATIRESVLSAATQQPPPLEIIVCDDGSDIDPVPLVEDIELARVIRINHGGEAAAKTTAARAAHGDFVVILDADDVFLSGRLAALSALAQERPDLDILTTDAWFTHNGVKIRRCYEGDHEFITENQDIAILQRNFIFGLAAIRKSALEAVDWFDHKITHTTDWQCWIKLLLNGSRVGCVMDTLAEYRLHEGAMNADRVAMIAGRIDTLSGIKVSIELNELQLLALEKTIANARKQLDTEIVRQKLINRQEARPALQKLLSDSERGWKTRIAATLAWLLPGLSGATLRNREKRSFRTVSGIRLPRIT